MDRMVNGGPPRAGNGGMATGEIRRNRTLFDEFFTYHPSWRWASEYPRQIMDAWMRPRQGATDTLPSLLKMHDGQVLAPALALHPVKT